MYLLTHPIAMDSVEGRRQLTRCSAVLVTLLAFVTPAAAQGSPVFGSSLVLSAAIAVAILLGICIILLFSLRAYTMRTSDIVIESPISTLVTGVGVTFALLLPYIALLLVAGIVDALGLLGLGLLTALAVPLLTVFLVAVGIGAIAAGRSVSEKEGVVLLVVTAIAAPIGAFPLPLFVIAALLTVFGVGAMFVELRRSDSELDSTDRETYGKQHRYM